ncbi:MAG: S26 family signal peptidase [Pirellulales bacterium]
MAKRKSTATKSEKPPRKQAELAAAPSRRWFSAKAIREAVEAVVVAFILAFLFRTFEAEAFVIPTGSMAPTLMGAHKDLYCAECGYQYRAGASSEEDQLAEQRGRQAAGVPVVSVTCPMCRYMANVGPGHDHPTYGGDRILVSKLAYEFGEPKRWDIIVFKFPAEAQTNYIKRCVGLPSETLRIWHGDLHVKPPGGDAFALTRREPRELRAMAQIVYDNDYVVDAMTKAGWPLRWQAWPSGAPGALNWTSSDGGRSFSIARQAPGIQWLRYRHFAPSLYDWQALKRGRAARDGAKPLLITDFYAYDTSIDRNKPPDQARVLGLHWVGDLLVECELESADGKGTALLDLVKGGRHFRCELNLETGQSRLAIDGLPNYRPKAQTGARGAGGHHVAFANIDRQLVLWVDGSPVAFDGPTDYEPLDNENPRSTPDDPLDLAPAGIGSQSAALSVSHIRLWRDIYYIAARSDPARRDQNLPSDYTGQARQIADMNYRQLLRFLSTPELWEPPGRESPFDERRDAVFTLKADQFFMLGDNSPMSLDARLWTDEKFVSRELLIGRALVIFWPHSFDRIPGTSIPFPFFPNFARMGFIR